MAAVAASTTLTEVLGLLGLSVGGASLSVVRCRMLELGLDRPDLLRMAVSEKWAGDPADAVAQAPTTGRWTQDELRMAVIASTSMREVLEHLGYRGSGGAWTAAKAQILELGLDISHFGRLKRRQVVRERSKGRRRWDDADLRRAVAASHSVAGVLRQLGLKTGGSMYVLIQTRIRDLGLNTSHFSGQGWRKGASHRSKLRVRSRRSSSPTRRHSRPRICANGCSRRAARRQCARCAIAGTGMANPSPCSWTTSTAINR